MSEEFKELFVKGKIKKLSNSDYNNHYSVSDSMDMRSIDTLISSLIYEWILKFGIDLPLAILVTTNHAMPTHLFALMGVLENLSNISSLAKSQGKDIFVHCVENDYLSFEKIAKEMELSISEKQEGNLWKHDKRGALLLDSMLACREEFYAALSFDHLWYHCIQRDIPTRFVDCSYADNGDLDVNDRIIVEEIEKSFSGIRISQCKDPTSLLGLTLRNRVMFRLSHEYREFMGANMIVMGCGHRHFSSWLDESNTEDCTNAIDTIFAENGYKVLTINFETDELGITLTSE